MADLNDLIKKAASKKSIPLAPQTNRTFGLKETMNSIKNENLQINQAQISTAPNYEQRAQDHTQYVPEPTLYMPNSKADDLNASTKPDKDPTQASTPIKHHSDTNQTSINEPVGQLIESEKISIKEKLIPPVSKPLQNNGVETVLEQPPNSVGMVLKNLIGVELVSKVGSERSLNTIYPTPISHHLDTIVGREREFLFFVANQCQKNGSLKTPPLTIEKVKTVLSCSKDSIKTVVYRLTQKSILSRETRKMGRGGWVCFSLPKTIYDQILSQEDFRNGVEMVLKVGSEQGLKSSSKIDSIYNNTNYLSGEQDTNGTQVSARNLSWFKDLDFSKIPIIRPMMINSAIRKQVETELDRDDVQIFINKFKNWLASQHKIQNPVAIFCEKLKEWCSEGASDVLYALSDEEIEAEKVFALEIEKKRAEIDLINKARAFKQEQDKEALFQEWFTQSTEEEKRSLYPETSFAKFGSDIYVIGLKDAFLNQKLG